MPKVRRSRSLSSVSGNWAALSKKIGAGPSSLARRASTDNVEDKLKTTADGEYTEHLRNMAIQWEGFLDPETKRRVVLGHDDMPASQRELGHFVALDCEMVGVGYKGSRSALARVTIVNWHGFVVLDTYVRPKEPVVDYRTWVSGVRKQHLKNAPTFEEVQKQVADILKGRVLVGHAVHNDLRALLLTHPQTMTRDTGTYKPLCEKTGKKQTSLRELASLLLGIQIQTKGAAHSPVEDARATMAIFRTQKAEWDAILGVGKKKRGKNSESNESNGSNESRESTATEAAIAAGAGIAAITAASSAAASASDQDTTKRPKGKGKVDATERRPPSAPEWWLE